jgi:group II intron reverse transcriptase/maturase
MDCIQSFYSLANTQLKYYWVIEGDIRNCFGAIPHHKLISQVARRIADPRILRLINRFLKSGIMERNKFVSSTEGVSQGDPLSPLLANIYLHSFDSWFSEQYLGPDCKTDYRNYHNWVRRRAKGKALAAAQIFRYADDWVVLVRGTKVQAASIKENIKQFLRNELKLELSEEKTHLTHIKDGFDFLGFHIFRNNKPKNRRRTGVFVVPTKPSFKRVRQKIREMTNRASLVDDYLAKLIALNAVIRGWANYYRAVNPMATFKKLDRFVWHRLARWLQAKHTTGTHKVRKSYQAYQPGVKGGGWEFGTMDEATGKWVWRYKAVETKLSYYRPKSKKYWPNPYLVDRLPKTEQFELPNLKAMWTGRKPAPEYEPIRRQVLGRAGGQCERCGNTTALQVHHKHRVGRREGKNKLKTADNRPEMLEALCKKCHNQEHRAEQIQQGKQMVATRTRQVIAKVSEPKLTG